MLDFCTRILLKADIDAGFVKVGMITYNTNAQVKFHLNSEHASSKQRTFEAIWNITKQAYRGTNTADALLAMHDRMFTVANGDRPDAKNVAVLVIDSISNINSHRTVAEASTAHEKNIQMCSIGIGLTNTTELYQMASHPRSQNAFALPGYAKLNHLAGTLGRQIYNTQCSGRSSHLLLYPRKLI